MSEELTEKQKLERCKGCNDDFYNDHEGGPGRCWALAEAKLATRYTIGHWTPMDTARNLGEVEVLSCYHERGPNRTHYLAAVPDHLKAEWAQLKAKGEK